MQISYLVVYFNTNNNIEINRTNNQKYIELVFNKV